MGLHMDTEKLFFIIADTNNIAKNNILESAIYILNNFFSSVFNFWTWIKFLKKMLCQSN